MFEKEENEVSEVSEVSEVNEVSGSKRSYWKLLEVTVVKL